MHSALEKEVGNMWELTVVAGSIGLWPNVRARVRERRVVRLFVSDPGKQVLLVPKTVLQRTTDYSISSWWLIASYRDLR
jgi:hypothetical protein